MSGIAGSSFNFTWTFSNGVETVSWGLKTAASQIEKLVTVGLRGQVILTSAPAFDGRVSASGSASSGSVIFILTNIQKSDDVFYGCKISPVGPYRTVFDYVRLAVQGG